MADWEIATVNVVWKEGWRCVGQIMRERGSWCWWVNKFPDPPPPVANAELVETGWVRSEQDARAAVERVIGRLTGERAK